MAKKSAPEPQHPERVIALIAGESGTGKSRWIANLENALIFDTDLGGGLAYLDARIARNGSERIEVGSYLDVLREVQNRRRDGTLARITTLAIDHLTTLQQEATNRHNPSGGEDYGKSSVKAAREWQKIREAVRVGDFHLFCTAHLKGKYEKVQGKSEQVGMTTDASKNINADFTMVLYLQRRVGGGYPSLARVEKWRRDEEDPRGLIPDHFSFTTEEFLKLHGFPLGGERVEVEMATPEQVREIVKLVAVVKLPDDTVDKWHAKAKAEEWSDFTRENLQKCIDYCTSLVKNGGQAA